MSPSSTTPVLGRPVDGPLPADALDTWDAPAGDLVVTITGEPGELTALCPGVQYVQPDSYLFEIRYRPGRKVVEGKSLKLFLLGFRDRRSASRTSPPRSGTPW